MPRSQSTRRCTACGRELAPTEHRSNWTGRGRCCRSEGNITQGPRAALAIVTPGARYVDDVGARLFVLHFPDGATLECVALAIGVTKERARQLEALALDHCVAALESAGFDADEIRGALLARAAHLDAEAA